MAATVAPLDSVLSSTDIRAADGGFANYFRLVLQREVEAVAIAARRLHAADSVINDACALLAECRRSGGRGRRVIVTGVGKAGLIGRKVTATLCSTGTPAIFVHPVEALHGDLGAICGGDVAVLFSYSGTTPEVVRLAAELQRLECPLIAVTRTMHSDLGRIAAITIELGEIPEACELGLAPTSTTAAMLIVGDALALTVANANGFSEREFAGNHPAGMLGLSFRNVSEYMRTGNRLVCVDSQATVKEVVRRVSAARTGAAVLVDGDRRLLGIFTDGDLRRALLSGVDIVGKPVVEFASIPCTSVSHALCVADAWKCMLDNRLEDLPIIDGDGRVVGLLCLKDIKW